MNRLSYQYLYLSLVTFLFGLSVESPAQSVISAPAGFCKLGAYDSNNNYLGLLANSDTLISVPFTRPPQYTGTIQTVAGGVVTVTGAPGWIANQFVYAPSQTNTYYALIGPATGSTNPYEGCTYEVTGNTANTVSLNLNGDSLSGVPANSRVTIIPYWTLSTLFPNSSANVSFTPTASTRSLKTQILIPDYTSAGVNLSYPETYYYISSGSNIGWRLFGALTTVNHGDDPLAIDGYLVVRNQNGAPTLPLLVTGTVPTWKWSIPLNSQPASQQDNALGLTRPVGVTLANSGLNPGDGSFRATTSTRSLQDQLFFYDNTQVAYNKSASATYFYYSNGANVGWRLFGAPITTDHGSDVIPAGTALTIRRIATSPNLTAFWNNTPAY